jgi:hypothetical protein
MHRLATLALVALTAAGCDNARKIVTPRGAVQNEYGCDQCHGYPPPSGVAGWSAEAVAHPQGDRATRNCHYCHPQTVESDNHTLIPASKGGHHQNGKIDYVHGHLPSDDGVAYADPSQHVPEALKGLARTGEAQDCYVCHGADLEGGIGYSCVACHNAPHGDPRFPAGVPDFRVNCTFCHGQPKQNFVADADLNQAAPPDALYPHALNDPASGAHQEHLGVGVACATCHTVPAATFPESLQHNTGTTWSSPATWRTRERRRRTRRRPRAAPRTATAPPWRTAPTRSPSGPTARRAAPPATAARRRRASPRTGSWAGTRST